MFGPHTPATLIVFAGALTLLIATISTPILRSIYFLSVDITPNPTAANSALLSGLTGSIKLGLFGYCVQLGSQQACSALKFGYTLDPTSLVSLPANLNLNASEWMIQVLTYPLILHPIASGLAFLSFLSGAISHLRQYSRSCYTSCLSSTAAAVALCAFIFDILAFTLAKNRINGTTNSNFTLNANLGNAVWITLAGWISLVLSGCFFCAGRCIMSRRQRDQTQANQLRPQLDQDYTKEMRQQAEKAEQAREKGYSPKETHSNLPAFAEYTDQDARNQEQIPLNSLHHEDERYNDHARIPDETLAGVGMGYGRRQPHVLSHQPSVMSQASTLYSHPSRSQFPSMPPLPPLGESHHHPLPPRVQSPYHHPPSLSNPEQFPLPSHHHQPSSDLYNNLPAHVTPASNSMNPPPTNHHQDYSNFPAQASNSMNPPPTNYHQSSSDIYSNYSNFPAQASNSMNPPLETGSLTRRLPQSLIPAGRPLTVGMIPQGPRRPDFPRGPHVTPPDSQGTGTQNPRYFPPLSSQAAVTDLAYSSVHVQPGHSIKPDRRLQNADEHLNSPGILPHSTQQEQQDTHHLFHSAGVSGAPTDSTEYYHNPPRATPQSSLHDDPYTQAFDHLAQNGPAPLSGESAAAAGNGHLQINCSPQLLAPRYESQEHRQPNGGDTTDMTSASLGGSSLEQSPLRDNTQESPEASLLPPLSFISPPLSPLHPRNNSDLTRDVAVESHDQQ